MRLYGVRIFVEDLEKARAFYGETLKLKETWAMPEANAAGYDLESGELIVEQEDMDGGEADLIGRFVGASLEVDDIDAVYAELTRRGVEFEGPPARQVWGGTLAHFKDPAGNILTLVDRHESAKANV